MTTLIEFIRPIARANHLKTGSADLRQLITQAGQPHVIALDQFN
jgi:hypothetical protein